MSGLFGTTPAPWPVSAYDEHAGYDCMTGGIEIGRHITLDAGRYGQTVSWESDEDSKFDMARLVADAKALGQVPALLALVVEVAAKWRGVEHAEIYDMARAIVAKLEEE